MTNLICSSVADTLKEVQLIPIYETMTQIILRHWRKFLIV